MLHFKGLNDSQEDLAIVAAVTIGVTSLIASITTLIAGLYIRKQTLAFIRKYWVKICVYIERNKTDDDFYTTNHAVLYVKDILQIQREYIKVCEKIAQLPKPSADDTRDTYEVKFTEYMKNLKLEYKPNPGVSSYKGAGYLNGRAVVELYENIDKTVEAWNKAVNTIRHLPIKFLTTSYVARLLHVLRADDYAVPIGDTWVIHSNGGPAMEINRYVWWAHSHIVKPILKHIKKDFQKYQKQKNNSEDK